MPEPLAIVTGAAGGIGRALVAAFLDAGYEVVAADLERSRLETAARAGARPVAADLRDPVAIDALVAGLPRPPAVLCNNAGIRDGLALVDEVEEDRWDDVIAVNLTGPFRLVRRCVPLMRDAGGGVIVNIASVAGLRGGRAGAAYTSAKWGLVGLTHHVAAAHGHEGIRCVALCPGGTERPADDGDRHLSERGATLAARDTGRPPRGSATTLAALAVFACSAAAERLNGVAIPVDDGLLAY